MELVKNDVMVEWDEAGEGLCGDYDENDPEDIELLRFYVLRKVDGEWVQVDDASYCTMFPVSTTEEQKMKALEYLMWWFYEPVKAGHSVKKLGERLSWIDLSWIGN